jgi:phospholipase C
VRYALRFFGLLLVMSLLACGGGSSSGSQTTSPNPPGVPTPATVPRVAHVIFVVEENHSFSQVMGSAAMPYLNSLASQYGIAANYFANSHPSIGNYFMLTTGQIITTDDTYSATVDADNLVRELVAGGKTWKSYAESLPSVGYTGTDVFPYKQHHNPFAYFSDVRNSSTELQNLVPFTQFATDLASNQLPTFSFVVPNALHDALDCPDGSATCTDDAKLSTADNWLKTNIGPLLSNRAFQQDGLLVIVFDESLDTDTSNGGGHVFMLVVSPKAKAGFQSNTLYQHQSTLRLVVEGTGAAGLPGSSASAPDMAEFF